MVSEVDAPITSVDNTISFEHYSFLAIYHQGMTLWHCDMHVLKASAGKKEKIWLGILNRCERTGQAVNVVNETTFQGVLHS